MKQYFLLIPVLLTCCVQVYGQLCNGSAGEPFQPIDFGTEANPAQPSPPGTGAYEFTFNGCPEPGKYSFGSRVFACYNTTWHTLIADHTQNDFDGLYMLVHGRTVTGLFLTDTITGLCELTRYEVSAYVTNMLRPNGCTGPAIQPKVDFSVESLGGTVLATFSTGKMAITEQQSWRQYGAVFQTLPGMSSVVIKVSNNADIISDCGNVFALDDISIRPCGPRVSATVGDNGLTTLNLCEGDLSAYTLKATVANGFVNPAFQWQESPNGINWVDIPGATGITLFRNPLAYGAYYYRLAAAEKVNINTASCRIYSNTVLVNFDGKPFVQVTNYVYGCYGSEVVLFAAGGSKFEWKGPNGFYSTEQGPVIPAVQFTDAGRYAVKVTTSRGCFDTGSVDLVVYPAAKAVAGPDISICEGSSGIISASGGTRYEWYPDQVLSNDSIHNPVASPVDTTEFIVKVTNEYGCSDYAYVTVNVWKKPQVNAGPDLKTRIGLPVTLKGSTAGTNLRYSWTPSTYITNPETLQTTADPPVSTTFTLTVTSNQGCGFVTDDVFVKVYDKIYIPNAFSPNGDGINDTWVIEPLDLFYDTDIKVFNRNGQAVYSSKGAYTPWDGKRNGTPLPVGVYYYILDLNIKNEKPLTGTLTILR